MLIKKLCNQETLHSWTTVEIGMNGQVCQAESRVYRFESLFLKGSAIVSRLFGI